jgi:hypothetical protein
MIDILLRCRKLATFLSDYSLGNVKLRAEQLIKDIDKYIEEEIIYK